MKPSCLMSWPAALLAALTAVATAGAAPSFALGDLVVAPTRVVLEGRTRAAEVSLIHRGAVPATYRIGFVELVMASDGSVREVEVDPASAASLVRFSPRQVTLQPGEAQVVRLQVRKPAELAAGEYRSHLVFRHIPDPTAATPQAEGTFSVSLVAVYGVSIPVIVRHGTLVEGGLEATAELVASSPEGTGSSLRVVLARTGDTSVQVDLVVEALDRRGEATRVGRVRGLAVYTPNRERVVEIRLEGDLTSATNLRLRATRSDRPGGPVMLEQLVPTRTNPAG